MDCPSPAVRSLGDAPVVDCRNGAVVNIDIDSLKAGESITLTVSGKDAGGNVYSAEAVYTKSVQTENTRVYLDIGLYPDWSAPYVYLWASGVKEYAPWPGIAMNSEGNGIYSFELPAELDGKTMNVIFSNNGANQHPDVQSTPGSSMILTAGGQWTSYNPPKEEPPATTPTEPIEPSETTPAPTPAPTKNSPLVPVLIVVGILCPAFVVVFFLLRKRNQ